MGAHSKAQPRPPAREQVKYRLDKARVDSRRQYKTVLMRNLIFFLDYVTIVTYFRALPCYNAGMGNPRNRERKVDCHV